MSAYRIVMEDATRYLPHNPTGREYQHYVYKGTRFSPVLNKEVPHLVFTGSKAECEDFVARMETRELLGLDRTLTAEDEKLIADMLA